MLKNHLSQMALILATFVCLSCANRGTPSGGEVDAKPPVITRSVPDNYSVNFDSKEIRIYFDEYIKMKNIQRNLIISPPMDLQPEITPLGSASKYITIKITDTLLPNTTYAINFGESIVDNNEENPYPYYRYVFSTGSYIDSLKVHGRIKDALNREADEFVSVMLYDVDSTFNDSIIYNQKPKYITNTLDSTTTFKLDNLKEGRYLLVAIKDNNSDYKFQQKSDKIGFANELINVTSDSSFYDLTLFKEAIDFRAIRGQLVSGQKIAIGYEGSHEAMKVKILSDTPDNFEKRITKDRKKDTLYYWYKPKLAADSLLFEVSHGTYRDTLTVKLKEQLQDSLTITAVKTGALSFSETIELDGSIPFESLDVQKVSLVDKDSIPVTFSSELDSLMNRYRFQFDKTEANSYKMQVLPGAFTDFFGNVNDTLNFSFKTREYADFGNLRLNLIDAVYPVIVQLVDQQGEVAYEQYAVQENPLDFQHIAPGNYYIRVIYDRNANGTYDSGNYLKNIQPERVSYYPNVFEVRASFDYIEDFTLLKE